MIRPIDMQMVIPRTDDISHFVQHENSKGEVINSQASTQVQKEVKQNSETVIKKDENAFEEYHYDAKNKGNNEYHNNRNNKNKKDNNEKKDSKEKKEVHRTNFDINI